MNEPGKEYLLLAASLEQARITYGFIRDKLEATGEYRWLDSATRVGITHKATNTRFARPELESQVRVWDRRLPGDRRRRARRVGKRLAVNKWPMRFSRRKAKPNSSLKVIFIGTLAPANSGWWHELVGAGSNRTTYVQSLTGDPEKWDSWPEIRRCNPLTAISSTFRERLISERDAARRDTRLKARFLSYRLNCPTGDESTMLPNGFPTSRIWRSGQYLSAPGNQFARLI